MKSHTALTADRAWIARRRVPGMKVFGGITLNGAAGGINVDAVRWMWRMQGGYGRVVWFPTFDAVTPTASSGSTCRQPRSRPAFRALHAWLDTWHGIGLIAHGLGRQDRDLSLTRYRARWGASVFVTGMEHSIVQGSGWQMTPWGAVQQAAFQALHRGRYWSDQPQVL